MTARQILLFCCAYMVELVAVVYFSRATARRVLGAMVGGSASGTVAVGAVVLGEAVGWWRVPSGASPYFWSLLFVGFAISCAPIHLVSWRVARRFGWRGLAVFWAFAAVVGPPRDYWIAAAFPSWMAFAPGLAPVLADSATYAGFVALGYAAMRMVAGPDGADRLARS